MNSWTSPVDIRPDDLAIVQEILRAHLPVGFKVWVFGSRANWTTKDSSDLDLAVEGVASLDHGVMVGLEIAFEESNLPYTVDVVDLNAVSPGFKRIVEDQRVLLPSMATNHLPDKKIVAGRHDTTQGWHQVNLGDIAEIFDGPHATPKKTENGPVFLGISNLVNGRIDISTAEHLSDSDYATWTKRVIPQPGDIVFSYETRLGEAAAIPPGLQCCLGRRMGLLRVSKELVDPQFLLYAYLGPEFQGTLQSRTVQGSTVDRILLTELGTFPIRIPLLPEQRAIAHILGTLDDKIELNRRMSRTLEEMARAIFQDWFVDFGPTRAKMGGQEPYLPPELWDLFPEQLVDSELGEIPEGWEVKPLSECIMIDKGLSYKGAGLSPTGRPMHNLNSVHEGGGYKDNGIKFYNGDFRNRHITRPGDVLVTNTEQGHDRLLIGFAAIVPSRFGKEGIFSHHIYRVQPKNYTGLTSDFICHLLNTKAMHETISGYATGTTVNMLPTDALVIPEIIVPSRSAVEIFSGFSQHARARQEKFIEECQQLTELRDNLLPRLVSGEVPVELADSPSEL